MEPHEIDAIHEALGHVRDRMHARHLLGKFGPPAGKQGDEQEDDKGAPAVMAIKVEGDEPSPHEKLKAALHDVVHEGHEGGSAERPEDDDNDEADEDPRASGHFKLGHMGG